MKDFASQLKRGTLELILLQLLSKRPAYGYELVRRLSVGDQPSIKEGTVYPVLYRLEDRGWIAPKWQAPRRGVPRKYYEMTDTGRARLEALRAQWRAFAGWVEDLLEDREEETDDQSR